MILVEKEEKKKLYSILVEKEEKKGCTVLLSFFFNLYSIALMVAWLVGLPSFVFVLRGFQPPSIPNSARDLYMGSSGNGPPGN